MHQYQDLIVLFDQCFAKTENTRLVKGESEPVYLPAKLAASEAGNNRFHQVVFAHGYYASALHEIAHWCIAGKARRQLEDYGYWYCPDGRDAKQQAEFELVEVKPQAIERAFSEAAGFAFKVSTDNLSGVEPDRAAFEKKVFEQYTHFKNTGFPPRAAQFIAALSAFYNTEHDTQSQLMQVAG